MLEEAGECKEQVQTAAPRRVHTGAVSTDELYETNLAGGGLVIRQRNKKAATSVAYQLSILHAWTATTLTPQKQNN